MKKVLGGFGKLVVFALGAVAFLYLVFFLTQGPILYSGRGALSRNADDWNAALSAVPMGNYKPWEVEAEGGQKIRGYETISTGQMPALIWIHGSDQNVTDISHYLNNMADKECHVFAMEWRGYTVAPGETSEANVLQDAMSVYDALSKRDDVSARRILAGGCELGAVLALKLATKRQLAGVIAFNVVPDGETALRRKIPAVPLAFALRDKYELRLTLPLVDAPVLFIHGTEDSLVPAAAFDQIVSRVQSPVKVVKVEGANRDEVPIKASKDVWETVGDFIARPGK
jgi:dipeptidyl aminopeptidase/acylaminoacyl peptidase